LKCRHCGALLEHVFIDLGHQPPSNRYLTSKQLDEVEPYFPLKAYVCGHCWLVQLPARHRAEELFTSDYAYFSSISSAWVAHASTYVTSMINRFSLNKGSFVVEVGCNDGYLLQFVRAAGIPCLGIEPTASTARAARARGIETLEAFFTEELGHSLARERRPADLIAATNVLAHVPNINDFVAAFRVLLTPEGVATFEFPHLVTLIEGCQFDTIYHEHYSYLSLHATSRIFDDCGLRIFDVEELPTHGGSLRIYACRREAETRIETPRVAQLLRDERRKGVEGFGFYKDLQRHAVQVKLDLLSFLTEQKRAGHTVAAYGAAAKGNTLLNFAGIKPDLLPFVCDAAPSKQGRFMPGSHIPIVPPETLKERRPDFLLILPWNLTNEIAEECICLNEWGGRMAVAIPSFRLLN